MNRIHRTAAAFALSAALLAATAPAAQARTLAKHPQPSAAIVAGGWFDAALTWLGSFVGAPHGQTGQSLEKATYPIPLPPPTGGVRPMGCSTIDPNGTAICHGGA